MTVVEAAFSVLAVTWAMWRFDLLTALIAAATPGLAEVAIMLLHARTEYLSIAGLTAAATPHNAAATPLRSVERCPVLANDTIPTNSTPASVSAMTHGSSVTIQTGFQPSATSDPVMATLVLPVHWTSAKNATPVAATARMC